MNPYTARRARLAAPVLCAVSAVHAAVTAAVTALEPHRVWGLCAAPAYAALALGLLLAARRPRPGPRRSPAPTGRGTAGAHGAATAREGASAVPRGRLRLPVCRGRLRLPVRRSLPFLAFAATAVVPLSVLVGAGSAQEEVDVVHRSAARLAAHGTPYLSPDELAGADYMAYNPYLPGMALLGLPHRFLGLDARFCFGAVFLLAFALSLRAAGVRGTRRRTAALAASPLVALPLATGGDDLPVVGLACLGLALAGEGEPRAGRAGLALAAACTLKATAWPALGVAVALLGARGGRQAVLRCAGAAAPLLLAGLVLPALADPSGLAVNAFGYPLGLAGADSPAATPLPGWLLGRLGPAGHALAMALLALAAALVLWSLCARPPRDARAAALRLALGLLTAMALMPASRFGYAVYPLVLALWAHWRKPDAPQHAATVHRRCSPSSGAGEWAHPRGDQRLPAPPGRHREVRARDRTPLPTR
ncbi:hypothetical protein [Streptomyces sp. PU-14G]|uniref:hypothetical protein n=1 Tax=Streptomyces sp. PU-14G TaxID=2800808 RepID=UPI0034DFE36F